MRGKGPAQHRATGCSGITPACAGKRKRIAGRLRLRQDHPRVCGEETHGTRGLARPSGSPPRMRGKGFFQRLLVLPSGITPAYAGKRGPVRRNGDLEPGSPPRMRGKAQRRAGSASGSGITPAYAGKSRCPIPLLIMQRDHPRVCGEKGTVLTTEQADRGSPPRMRGKVSPPHTCCNESGITPAYAGKRLISSTATSSTRDHPRVCGEKHNSDDRQCTNLGSPPRMRGKANCGRHLRYSTRITPAYAGKRLKRSHSIGHFSCILCLFHSVLHRASVSGGSRAGPCAPPCLPAQNTVPV